jgi:hypothetical protein
MNVSPHPFVFDSRFRGGSDAAGSFRVAFRDLPLPFRSVTSFVIRNVVVTTSAISDRGYLLLRIPELDGFENPLMSNSPAGLRSFCTLIPDKTIGSVTRFDVLTSPHIQGVLSKHFPSQNHLTFELIDPATELPVHFGPNEYWMISGQYCTDTQRNSYTSSS